MKVHVFEQWDGGAGNLCVSDLIKHFPNLGPLAEVLSSGNPKWLESNLTDDSGWSWLFCINWKTDPPELKLEIKRKNWDVEPIPMLPLNPASPPSMREVIEHVFAHTS